MKKRFYVVWSGLAPGVYTSWEECKAQTTGVKNARYKSFATESEARKALKDGSEAHIKRNTQAIKKPAKKTLFTERALAVDAACSGNPGQMEYRGVDLITGKQVFHYGPIFGTNNIGEFLAIVHAVSLLTQKGMNLTVYSDSRNAIGWFQAKKCRTKLPIDEKTREVWDLIRRAENWLLTHTHNITVLKWPTEKWGEIPADFGRK